MAYRDRNGHPLSTTSSQAAASYNEGIERVIANGAFGDRYLRDAVDADEGFALAHVALARQLQFQGDMPGARAALERAKALTGGINRREQQHVATIAACMESGTEAALAMVREHVAEWPTDAWVLYQASGVYSLVGFSGHQDREQEQLELLAPLEEAYGDDWWYLSALAFAENELYMREPARRHAERSLNLFERSGHTAHTVAHVYFEAGDVESGAGFLAGWRPGFEREATMYGHLAWHHALFELISGNFDRVDAIYEAELRPSLSQAPALSRVADAASLLWRLMLGGRNGDLPWQELSAFANESFPSAGLMFGDVHCAFAHAAAGDVDALERLTAQLKQRAEAGRLAAGSVVPALAEAIAAFARGDYAGAVEVLEPRLAEVVRIGGSHAQREVIEDTLIEACFRSGQFERAERLLRARVERRPSPRDTSWLARVSERQAMPA
jgi:hypothetical protein